jgi:hypothetical protein
VEQKYLSANFDEESNKLSCKLSPVRRMKRHEQKEQDTENIETTFKSSPNKFVINPTQAPEELDEVDSEPVKGKTLLEEQKDS